jgi:NAD(P)-dependent dehydrogenase (short-subunit alcohol dehydrogenase family)
MLCRNKQKSQPLCDEINADAGKNSKGGRASLVMLDTSVFSAVHSAVAELDALDVTSVDVLILNAGIMFGKWQTARTESKAHPEVELMMATNHLGHFLLTNLLLPKITSTPGSRIVAVSSMAVGWDKGLDYDIVLAKTPEKYSQFRSYAQSKIANLLFTHELAKRLAAAGSGTLAIAAHPGYSRTNLQSTWDTSFVGKIEKLFRGFVSHDDLGGAMPLVMASVDVSAKSKSYYCPSKMNESKGPPMAGALWRPYAKDDALSLKLWETSESLVGFKSTI